jgi:hypothetical protein
MGMAIEELYIQLFHLPLTQVASKKRYFAGFLQLASLLPTIAVSSYCCCQLLLLPAIAVYS